MEMDLKLSGKVEFATTFLEEDDRNPPRMEIPFELDKADYLTETPVSDAMDRVGRGVNET